MNARPPMSPRKRQRGQAFTEFLVVALALVPLFLLMPMIAKYQSIAHSTQMAARYAAFDATTRNDAAGSWKPEEQLANEVRRRFFGNSDAPIKTGDVADDTDAHRNLFWRRPDGAALIPSYKGDVHVSYGAGRAATHGEGFQGARDGDAFTLHKSLSLPARGIYTANVSVTLADLPAGLKAYEPFDRIGLVMTRSTSLAIDPWAGKNPSDVQRKLNDPLVFPTQVLSELLHRVKPLDEIVQAIELPGRIHGPRLGELDYWHDVVPPDRLREP